MGDEALVAKELTKLIGGGILVFDTSFDEGCLIWVKPSGNCRATRFDSSTRASEGLVETLEEWLAPEDIASLRAIVLGLGPGSFTGVRVAAATAKGIAAASSRLSIYGISSLEWLAHSSGHSSAFAVVVDARQDEVYVRTSGTGVDQIMTINKCKETLRTAGIQTVISNWPPAIAHQRLGHTGTTSPLLLSVESGLRIALSCVQDHAALKPHEIAPCYMKSTPAERNLQT